MKGKTPPVGVDNYSIFYIEKDGERSYQHLRWNTLRDIYKKNKYLFFDLGLESYESVEIAVALLTGLEPDEVDFYVYSDAEWRAEFPSFAIGRHQITS